MLFIFLLALVKLAIFTHFFSCSLNVGAGNMLTVHTPDPLGYPHVCRSVCLYVDDKLKAERESFLT